MTLPNDIPLAKLQFYVTTPYSCGYLPVQLAQSLIASPQHLVDAPTYNGLIQLGFRRSGKFVYRPHCELCNACIPVRLPVKDFKPTRSQRRAFKQHQSLTATIIPLTFNEEHFALYSAYQIARHDGAKDHETAEQYRNFLVQSNVESMMAEFRLDGDLKMVSVLDIVGDGISAVYTFYDASDAHASYGTYNVMWLTEWCKANNFDYLYLGYWIKESAKMAYKQKFVPQEALIDTEWVPIALTKLL
ncbi:MAG: arginyltransferase [Methylophilaceae bacterium]|uniref:arginyltransferase n=1 Tax=Methylovorus sp. MM2 TaxID=1848038 RepID=UPI0007DF522C|nr:arginyltransferase [Methylovorus sp. MM2]OAM52720.1 arginyltransferase [Methylovorus sp. MM2]